MEVFRINKNGRLSLLSICISFLMISCIEDGIHKKYYENGQLKSEIEYKDGKQNGIEKLYYENGQLESEMYYENGQLRSGNTKSWYENGQLRSENISENGKQFWKKYYENGQLLEEWESEEGDEGLGKVVIWSKNYYENGQLQKTYNIEGENNSNRNEYYSHGQLKWSELKVRDNQYRLISSKTMNYYENGDIDDIWYGEYDVETGEYKSTNSIYYRRDGSIVSSDGIYKNYKPYRPNFESQYYKSSY